MMNNDSLGTSLLPYAIHIFVVSEARRDEAAALLGAAPARFPNVAEAYGSSEAGKLSGGGYRKVGF